MRSFMKFFLILSVLISAAAYISGCSSAEQTTGMLAYNQGDYTKAETEFQKELQRNPANEEAWFYLGASRIMLGKYKEAEVAFTEYRKIGKNSYRDQILDAWTKRFNSGADKFAAAQKTKDVNEQIKLYNESVNEFKVALIILPDSTMVQKYIDNINGKIALLTIKPYLDKGVELLDKGDFQGAVDEFKKGLGAGLDKSNPNYYVIQYNIGIAYLKWGEKIRLDNQSIPDDKSHLEKYKEALTYLEELRDSPDKKDQLTAYELLVQVYGNLNMQDKALEAIKKRDELKAELNK
jgi:tetratricopeptide (TPR) repeat protein